MTLGVRWTIGDVSARGFEALKLSIHCAIQLFPADTHYAVCVNSVPLAEAQRRIGPLPVPVRWIAVTPADMPPSLRPHLGEAMAEGVGWKLLPMHVFPDRHELALDNDCILWRRPAALDLWLQSPGQTLMAQDTERCLGIFQHADIPGNINSGIRGLPPGFPLEATLRATLAAATTGPPLQLHSELDEQGLQAAALAPTLLVTTHEVSICSPFWPREPELGSCGAHFVGLNSRHIPWNYFDRPADIVRREHFDRHRPALYRHARLELPPPLPLDA